MSAGEEDQPKATPYRWTCPACRESRSGIAGADENWKSKAIESLKTHIRGRGDDVHGCHGVFPSDLEDDALRSAVEPRDGP